MNPTGSDPMDDGPVRILVIDDSGFNRRAIMRMLESNTGIQVVGTAANGEEGLRQLQKLEPDVVTLDLEMPKMDGFTFLRIAAQTHPVPVLVISSRDEASSVFQALELGAADFVVKPAQVTSHKLFQIKDELLAKILELARLHRNRLRVKVRPAPMTPLPEVAREEDGKPARRVVAIGTSTGGPPALQYLLSRLRPDLPAGLLVTQHMPKGFTRAFADRLDMYCPFKVSEAAEGDLVAEGQVLVAPGHQHMTLVRNEDRVRVHLVRGRASDRYVPSVDRMLETTAESFGRRTIAVLLTGMGDDGKTGMVSVRKKRGRTIAESEKSAVVFGMPREAIATGAVERIAPLDEIVDIIHDMLG